MHKELHNLKKNMLDFHYSALLGVIETLQRVIKTLYVVENDFSMKYIDGW